jgi:hypothetical protein
MHLDLTRFFGHEPFLFGRLAGPSGITRPTEDLCIRVTGVTSKDIKVSSSPPPPPSRFPSSILATVHSCSSLSLSLFRLEGFDFLADLNAP